MQNLIKVDWVPESSRSGYAPNIPRKRQVTRNSRKIHLDKKPSCAIIYPIRYCIPNQFFNRNNKVFNVKVHKVIDRCRLVVTHWNKWVTLKLFSRKCNSWWWYFKKSQWPWLLQCIEFSQGSWFSAKQPSFPPRHDSALNAVRSLTGFDFASPFLAKKNPFFPHAFALRYSNFKAFFLGMQKKWILNLGMNIIMN